MKKLYIKDQVELCEYYDDRFSISELAQIYEISEHQVRAILEKFKVELRTEMF